MGSYNFKYQFEPFILDWSKRHTIRGERKHPDRPGRVMHLFTGLRHPGARSLMRAMCVRTEFIRIDGGPQASHQIRMGLSLGPGKGSEQLAAAAPTYGSTMGGPMIRLAEDELQALAWRDGFRPEGSSLDNPGDAFRLMMSFWDGRLPFEGEVYHWNPSLQLAIDEYGIRRWGFLERPGAEPRILERGAPWPQSPALLGLEAASA